jgi:hypothetical protein
MRSLTELDADALKLANEFTETLIRFKAYLPPGGLLLMLLSKFRDDVREVLEVETEGLPHRPRERRSLDELTSTELVTVADATGILLDRFAPYMDDPGLPRLLRDFQDALGGQRVERAQIRASIAAP